MRRNFTVLMAASIAFAAVLSSASAEEIKKIPTPTPTQGEAQSRSDLGQQLQLSLQEANNIFTRSTKAHSDTSAKHSAMLDGIAQNMK